MSIDSELLTEPANPSVFSDGLLRGCGCPHEGLDTMVLQLVGGQIARETTSCFLERHAALLDQLGPGVTGFLASWVDRDDNELATWWHEAFGDAYLAIGSNDPDLIGTAAATLALHLAASGTPGAWTIDLGRAARPRWGDWLLPGSTCLAVSSDGALATVTTSSAGETSTMVFHRHEQRWRAGSAAVDLLPAVGTRQPPIVLLAEEALGERRLAERMPKVVTAVEPETVDRWQSVLALIATYAPLYDDWVQRAVRQIVLLEPEPGLVLSGSYQYRYGLIHASASASAMSLAEILVHEASHQYYYMLSRLGPVDDGTDTATYFSPFVGRERPLDRILLAYHACGNILLFYQLCQAAGAPDDGYCELQFGPLWEQLQQLGAPLRDNPALTWIGRTLHEPLAERLAQA